MSHVHTATPEPLATKTMHTDQTAVPEEPQTALRLTALACELVQLARERTEEPSFLSAALSAISLTTGADYCAVVGTHRGQWTVLQQTQPQRTIPLSLLAAALDAEAACTQPPWLAVPLARPAAGELLAVHAPRLGAAWQEPLARVAALLGQSLGTLRLRSQERHRLNRLEAVLEVSSRLYQADNMEKLLVEIAKAAARLLESDRASIFLWDRPNKLLVARPALGVGEELCIPDTTGVVGQVLRTGRPLRVSHERGQEKIFRGVDARLGYQTETLLCVPLRGRDGELFGVFEAVNKLDGDFTEEDEALLIRLAAQAAVALENTQQREALLQSRRLMSEQAAEGIRLIGESPAIAALRSTIRRVAETDLAVLILGENGTGKEVVSRSIHYLSRRRDQPFVAVNCAALSETLLESELFGHEKGAFTDAHEARAGKFELARGGTLLLDEIGDLSPSGQAKLLRVLEDKVVVRVGGSASIATDTRVIAATNQNLAEMVRQRRFRQDLYFRLNVVTLVLPPLRERREDIVPLAEYFLQDFCRKARRKPPRLTAAARRRLQAHAWPGNVRELRNLMERLAYLSSEDRIDEPDLMLVLDPLAQSAAGLPHDLSLSSATSRFQTEYIRRAIERCGGNVSNAARALGVHRSNLYRKMRQLGMLGAGEEGS